MQCIYRQIKHDHIIGLTEILEKMSVSTFQNCRYSIYIFTFVTFQVPSINTVQIDLQDWYKTREVLKTIGPVDLLVNNAGIVRMAPFLETQKRDLDEYAVKSSDRYHSNIPNISRVNCMNER